MNPFKCPKCGGSHFGRDTFRNSEGIVDMLNTVHCHSAGCNWHGVWTGSFDHCRLRRPSVSVNQRVTFLNTLRTIIEKSGRLPKNKTGATMISDFDLLAAPDDEKEAAAQKAGIP